MFSEHLQETPPHPLAQLAHYGQPVLGVLLLSEGLLRLGVQLLDRDRNQRIWVKLMASTTSGHVILCGLGSVGYRIAEELLGMGMEVYAIEKDEHGPFVARARAAGVHVLPGDARQENLLAELHVKRARAVIAATDDDLVNLEIAMDVRELAPGQRVVVRLFDQKLAEKVRSVLGIEASVSTSRLAAPLFASAALDPCVVGTHRVGDTVLLVVQLKITARSPLRGKALGALAGLGLTAIAVRRAGAAWDTTPATDRVLTEGEEVQVMVPSRRLAEVQAFEV
jgi:Trk K+ transport system NAD-binding subunit